METPFWTSRMTLYTDTESASGHVLRLLVAEKECPCNIEVIRGDVPQLLDQINPTGRLPFLTDKMLALFDYNSIILYLQERFPAAEFLPEHAKIRAQIRQVCAHLNDYAAVSDSGMFVHTEGWHQQVADEISDLLDETSPWLLGDEFTLADVFASALLYRLVSQDTVVATGKLQRYIERLFTRESFQESLKPVMELQAA